jgi:hypothetical protein
MSAAKYSFTIEQGATTDFEIQYKDSASTAIDLTNYSGKMEIKSAAGGTTFLTLSSSLASDGTGLNFSGSGGTNPPTSGSIGIFISAASSSALTFTGSAKYDLEISSGSAYPYVTRLLEGEIKLSNAITT